MDKGKGLAILIADKMRGKATDSDRAEVDYRRMAKDLLAAVETKDHEALADILEALATT